MHGCTSSVKELRSLRNHQAAWCPQPTLSPRLFAGPQLPLSAGPQVRGRLALFRGVRLYWPPIPLSTGTTKRRARKSVVSFSRGSPGFRARRRRGSTPEVERSAIAGAAQCLFKRPAFARTAEPGRSPPHPKSAASCKRSAPRASLDYLKQASNLSAEVPGNHTEHGQCRLLPVQFARSQTERSDRDIRRR